MRFTIFFTVASLFFAFDQNNKEGLILGEWKEYKQRTVSGDSLTWAGKKLTPSYHVEYLKDGKGRDLTWDDLTFRYLFTGDTLVQGDRKFVVQKLSSNEMILRAWDWASPSEDDLVHFFKRIDR